MIIPGIIRLMDKINQFFDHLSDFFAHRKGLLPLLGLMLIAVNFIITVFFQSSWLAQTNLFLHLGLLLAIIGMLLAWAL